MNEANMRGGKREGTGPKPIYDDSMIYFLLAMPESWKQYYLNLAKETGKSASELMRDRLNPE